MSAPSSYYVPPSSRWPILGAGVCTLVAISLVQFLHGLSWAPWFMGFSLAILVFWMALWFYDVIGESLQGVNNAQVDRSYRLGMLWFIISEVWLFAALFGVLFYARWISVPSIGGEGGFSIATKEFLYPHFHANWPLLINPDNTLFKGPHEAVSAWGLPFYNTIILLLSAFMLTRAQRALAQQKNRRACFWTLVTVFLGAVFLCGQVLEYAHAITEQGITLQSGIYASTFYILTGFHGMHVAIGSLFLLVVAIRLGMGHFQPKAHFAFQAASWYWNLVDVVWWALFLFVYCL